MLIPTRPRSTPTVDTEPIDTPIETLAPSVNNGQARGHARFSARVESAAIVYLALPIIIFFFGWLKLPIALVASVAVVASVALAIWHWNTSAAAPAGRSSGLNLRTGLALFVLALVWTGLSGAGGFGVQKTDYEKHNAILRDLMVGGWPLAYDAPSLPGGVTTLVYYTAWYLPAALVGKALGWAAAQNALFVWTLIGSWLSLAAVCKLVARWRLLAAAVFVVAGGMDVIGFFWYVALMQLRNDPVKIPWSNALSELWRFGDFIEWWPGLGHYQYTDNTELLYWVPHQALAGWLGTALILIGILRYRSSANVGLVWACTLLWSPLVAVGLVPFVALAAIKTRFRVLSPQNVLGGGVIASLVGLYMLSRSGGDPYGWNINSPTEWGRLDYLTLVIFWIIDFGVFAVICLRSKSTWSRETWSSLLLASTILLLLPLVRFGLLNDFVMRASIPALFVLWVCVARGVVDLLDSIRRHRPDRRLVALMALVVVASFTAFEGARPSLEKYAISTPNFDRMYGLIDPRNQGKLLTYQYTGETSSFFFRHLAGPLHIVAKNPQTQEE